MGRHEFAMQSSACAHLLRMHAVDLEKCRHATATPVHACYKPDVWHCVQQDYLDKTSNAQPSMKVFWQQSKPLFSRAFVLFFLHPSHAMLT